MNKVLWCSFLILIMCLRLSAQESNWNLLLINGKELSEVTPTSVTSDSLLFQSAMQGSTGVQISDIRMVTYRVGPSKAGKGLAIGLLTGGAVGYVAGLIADGTKEDRSSYYGSSGSSDQTNYKILLPVVGGLVGGFAGFAIGSGSGRRSLDLALMGSDEKRLSLARLLNPGSIEPGTTPSTTSHQRDVVYLKNGSIVRGTIAEIIPDSTLRMTTADGSLFVFRMSEVGRVEKETVSGPTQSAYRADRMRWRDESDSLRYPEPGRLRIGFCVGGGFPIAEFASTTGQDAGAAKGGFVVGAELDYHIKHVTSWVTSVAVAFNAYDTSPIKSITGLSADAGSWVTIWPMTGIRLSPSLGSSTSMYIQGQLGMLFGNSPEMTISSSTVRAEQPSFSATSFAFSLGAGFLIQNRTSIGARYLYGSPEYDVSATSGSVSLAGKIK